MSILKLERNRCGRDGICGDECPMKIITFDNENYPEILDGAEKLCIDCGHCVAICPKAALTIKEISPEKCIKLDGDWKIEPDRLTEFFRGRRSIRTYKRLPAEEEHINLIISNACAGPSALNIQPVKWKVINSYDKTREVVTLVLDWVRHLVKENHPWAEQFNLTRHLDAEKRGIDSVLLDAPSVIIAYGSEDIPNAPKDSAIALTYAELTAASLGLGACWAGYLEAAVNLWEPLRRFLNIPEGYICTGALMLGYPKYRYRKAPPKNLPNVEIIK